MVHLTKRTFYDLAGILHTLLSLSPPAFMKKLSTNENNLIPLLVLVFNLRFMNTLVL